MIWLAGNLTRYLINASIVPFGLLLKELAKKCMGDTIVRCESCFGLEHAYCFD
jgi:hypothetical protein